MSFQIVIRASYVEINVARRQCPFKLFVPFIYLYCLTIVFHKSVCLIKTEIPRITMQALTVILTA